MIRNLRTILYVVAILLFVFNYNICEYFYPLHDQESTNSWWCMKVNINSLVTAIVLTASGLLEKGVLRFILEVGAGFAVSNVVDRLYFNTVEFTKADILMIIVTLIIATIDYKKDELTTDKQRDTDKYSKSSRRTS